MSAGSKQQRCVERLREKGGRTGSMQLSRTGAEALDLICDRHLLTRRDAVEAALIDAAMQGETFNPRPLKFVREHGCSVVELRHLSMVQP